MEDPKEWEANGKEAEKRLKYEKGEREREKREG